MLVQGHDFSAGVLPDPATVAALKPHVNPRRAARMNLIVGKRKIRFITRRGLDAIRGEQDIRIGTQVLLASGTTVSGDRDSRELRGSFFFFRRGLRATVGFSTRSWRWRVPGLLSRRAEGESSAISSAISRRTSTGNRMVLTRHTVVARGLPVPADGTASFRFNLRLAGLRVCEATVSKSFPPGSGWSFMLRTE